MSLLHRENNGTEGQPSVSYGYLAAPPKFGAQKGKKENLTSRRGNLISSIAYGLVFAVMLGGGIVIGGSSAFKTSKGAPSPDRGWIANMFGEAKAPRAETAIAPEAIAAERRRVTEVNRWKFEVEGAQLVQSAPAPLLPDRKGATDILARILPKTVVIPAAEAHMSDTRTVADMAGGGEAQPVAGYVLGKEGMSPEMLAAFRVVQRGKAPTTVHQDGNVFREAASEIGYVPAGVDPNAIRKPGAPLGKVGEVISGDIEVISGHLLAVNGRLVHLQGARAPDADDICRNADGAEYDCASWSKAGMGVMVSEQDVRCEITKDEHPDGGAVGWCNVKSETGEEDLAAISVQAGILVPDRGSEGFSPYDIDEREAKTRGYGVWSGSFEPRK